VDPQISTGVVNQADWPKPGDIDECWCAATLQAIHAVFSWLRLVGFKAFRAAAGNPDEVNKADGGTIRQIRDAIRALWPKAGALIETSAGERNWTWLEARLRAGHVCVVFVLSSELSKTYGFGGTHACTAAFVNGKLRFANPLAPAFARWDEISWGELERAIKAFPNPGVHAVVMPLVDVAFPTHPLYVAPGTPDPDELAKAEARGYERAKAKAAEVAAMAIAGI
jgi:hypothetical protein